MEEAVLKWVIEGMMDDKMYYNPRVILDKLVKTEEMEIPLYYELARGAPNEHLRKTIEYMARREKEEVEQLKMLYDYFPTYSTNVVGNKAEAPQATSMYGAWLDGVKRARDIEVRQCYWLCHLAMYAPDPHVHKMILDLAKEELQQAMFWNDIYAAYSGMPAGYPGPSYPGPGYPDPGYHGPGYDNMPGMYSEQKKKDEEKK